MLVAWVDAPLRDIARAAAKEAGVDFSAFVAEAVRQHQPCLAHLLDEVREELRIARLASHVGQSCEMLAARLVAVETVRDVLARSLTATRVQRDEVRDEVERLKARLGERAEYESGVHCAHGVATCDRCSEVWSAERRRLSEETVSARKLLGHAFAENTRLADVARRQREACAVFAGANYVAVAEYVRGTPLVTEEAP